MPRRKKNKITRTLPCKLTDEEQRQRGIQLAEREIEYEQVLAEKKTSSDAYSATAKSLRTRITDLTAAVNDKQEDREIEVVWEFHYANKEKYLVRQDTMESIEKRTLTADELQMTLGPQRKNGVKKAGKKPKARQASKDKATKAKPKKKAPIKKGTRAVTDRQTAF